MSCGKSELCIFDHAAPQVVIDSSVFEELFPVNSFSESSNAEIDFRIVASDTDYLDLNDTLLYVKVKVTDSADAALADAVDVTPSNMFFHSIFKDVILSLNGVKIEGGNDYYAQKAMIETLINYNRDTKKSSLTPMGFDEDNDVRKAWVKGSATFSMCSSLQLDFFDQPKYIIPGVNVHLRLQRHKNEFCLISKDKKPKLKILEARLYVRRVRVEPSVLMGHQLGLNHSNAVYPIRKTKFVVYSLAIGMLSYYKELLFGDTILPKFVLITFQSNSAYTGAYKENPSLFKHCNVSSMTLSRNTDFHESYTTDFTNNNYMTAYTTSLIRNMGHLDKNLNVGITSKDFIDKYPFFTFVLAPDFDIYQTQIEKQGNLRLDIKFASALTEATSLLIYGIYDTEIQINKNRTVII